MFLIVCIFLINVLRHFLNSSCKWNELKDKKDDQSSQPELPNIGDGFEESAMSREREPLTHEMPAAGLPQEAMQKTRLQMNYPEVSGLNCKH